MGLAFGATLRASRLAMGTVVGINVVSEDVPRAEAAIDLAYAEIERWEARLSEWRPDSLTTRLNTSGGPVVLPPEGSTLLAFAERLRVASGGHFDLLWRGAPSRRLWSEGDAWFVEGGSVDLGGMLKGFLNDRAGAVLRAQGLEDFLIDAAGDVLAHGDAEGRRGWRVAIAGTPRDVVLVDEALSTSGNREQPGHIVDATTGTQVRSSSVVSVVARDAVTADALATAIFAGAPVALAGSFEAVAVRFEPDTRPDWSPGARRRFR